MILYTTKIPLKMGIGIFGGDGDGDLLESSYVEVSVTNISEEADGNRRVYYRCNLYTGRKNGKGKAIYDVTLTGFNNDEKKEIEISEGLSLVATGEGSAIDTSNKEYWSNIDCGDSFAGIKIDADVFLVNNEWGKTYGMSMQQNATIAEMPIESMGQTIYANDLHYGVPFEFSASGNDADSCKIDFFIDDEKVYSKSIDSLSGEITVPAEVYKTHKKNINKEKITYYKNEIQVFKNPYSYREIKETEATIKTIAKRESESSAVVNVECFGNLAAISTSYTIKIYYKETSAKAWIEGKTYIGTSNNSSTTYDVTITLAELSIDYAYDIYATIDDGFTSAKSINSRVYSKQYIMDVRTDGKGIAFGGTAASEDEMYCGFKTFRANNIIANGSVCDANGNLRLAIPRKVSALENDTGYVTKDALVTNAQIVDLIYPIGSIYMSVNSTSPATLFGGKWERIQDRFLLAAGSTYAAGGFGGEATHTLTVYELPDHRHTFTTDSAGDHTHSLNRVLGNSGGDWTGDKAGNLSGSGRKFGYINSDYTIKTVTNTGSGGAHTHSGTTNGAGGSQPHNNMPPYLTVYMWKRTA